MFDEICNPGSGHGNVFCLRCYSWTPRTVRDGCAGHTGRLSRSTVVARKETQAKVKDRLFPRDFADIGGGDATPSPIVTMRWTRPVAGMEPTRARWVGSSRSVRVAVNKRQATFHALDSCCPWTRFWQVLGRPSLSPSRKIRRLTPPNRFSSFHQYDRLCWSVGICRFLQWLAMFLFG